jgi:hypothetical protein
LRIEVESSGAGPPTLDRIPLGGMLSSLVHVLIVTPVIWTTLKEWDLRKGRLGIGPKKVA